MNLNKLIIAVDGFSSCGKSTFAKAISAKLDLLYIDSGAMYRAVTHACLIKRCINNNSIDVETLNTILAGIDIQFKNNPTTNEKETYLNGENIEKSIRGIEVSNHVSVVSKESTVREKLVALQRKFSENSGVVMDGRDIGTVVFPNADLKIFMTASVEVRAERRYKELIEKGIKASYEEIKKNIETRDYIDQNREISPLKKASDAIVLDNSNKSPEDQMAWFNQLIEKMK